MLFLPMQFLQVLLRAVSGFLISPDLYGMIMRLRLRDSIMIVIYQSLYFLYPASIQYPACFLNMRWRTWILLLAPSSFQTGRPRNLQEPSYQRCVKFIARGSITFASKIKGLFAQPALRLEDEMF